MCQGTYQDGRHTFYLVYYPSRIFQWGTVLILSPYNLVKQRTGCSGLNRASLLLKEPVCGTADLRAERTCPCGSGLRCFSLHGGRHPCHYHDLARSSPHLAYNPGENSERSQTGHSAKMMVGFDGAGIDFQHCTVFASGHCLDVSERSWKWPILGARM